MALSDAPLHWSDTENIKWKTAIPGRGHSSPVLWGDRIFVTTAVLTGPPPVPGAERRRPAGGSPNGDTSPQPEHKFLLICLDKKTGKVLWEKTARTAAPHEGYHQRYGSFASNSPVTDGKRVYAFFGSRGVYCYDLDGKLIWEKDFDEIDDCWDSPGREKTHGPFLGRLANSLKDYPETLNLKLKIVLQPAGTRPLFYIEESEHPLAQEQQHGISHQWPWRGRRFICIMGGCFSSRSTTISPSSSFFFGFSIHSIAMRG